MKDSEKEDQEEEPGLAVAPEGSLSRKFTLGLSSVLVLGLHWTGAKVASRLAQAAVGKVLLVDNDQRFVQATLREIMDSVPNKESPTKFYCRELTFDAQQAELLIAEVDLVIDCLENWQNKLVVSDVCMHLRKPLIHAGGSGMRFQLYTMRPGKSACLRCAFPLQAS